ARSELHARLVPDRACGSVERNRLCAGGRLAPQVHLLHAEDRRAGHLARILLVRPDLREAGKEERSAPELHDVAAPQSEPEGCAGSAEAGFVTSAIVTPRRISSGYGLTGSPFHHSFVGGNCVIAKCKCGVCALPVE